MPTLLDRVIEKRWVNKNKINTEDLDLGSTDVLKAREKSAEKTPTTLVTKMLMAAVVVVTASSYLLIPPISSPKEVPSVKHPSKTEIGQKEEIKESTPQGSTETKKTVQNTTRQRISTNPAARLNQSPSPTPNSAPQENSAPQPAPDPSGSSPSPPADTPAPTIIGVAPSAPLIAPAPDVKEIAPPANTDETQEEGSTPGTIGTDITDEGHGTGDPALNDGTGDRTPEEGPPDFEF